MSNKIVKLVLRVTRRVFGPMLILGLSGCATAGPKYHAVDAPAGKVLVYLYRPSRLTAYTFKPAIYVNGAQAGRLYNGTYAVLVLDPGAVKLRAVWAGGDGPDNSAEITTAAGQSYYVRVFYPVGTLSAALVSPLFGNGTRGEPVALIPAEAAAPEIASLTRRDLEP